jgi:uncharacterized protein YcbK (DUF882 family)
MSTKVEQLEGFIDGLGLRYFRGREFTPYWSRTRNGVRNAMPPVEIWGNIVRTLVVLDELRAVLGAPITLLSTYRSPAYNAAVGGEKFSFHMKFMAIDFTSGRGVPSQWGTMLRKLRGRRFQIPEEGEGSGGLTKAAMEGTSWVFRGGIGVYPESGFVHLDCRGVDADW